ELFPKRGTLFRVLNRDLDRSLSRAEPAHAMRQSRGREADLRDLETVAGFAEDEGVVDADMVVFDFVVGDLPVILRRGDAEGPVSSLRYGSFAVCAAQDDSRITHRRNRA